MSNSILSMDVSLFDNCSDTIPKTVNLLSWLTSEKYRDKVIQIRNIQDEHLQKTIKETLPGITPSGVFSYRDEKHFVSHSGFLAFDIDFKDNQHLTNFSDLKDQISHILSVAYCGLSVRGKGFWGLLPVPKCTPADHKRRFESLEKDFRSFGIILDNRCKNICHLRIYSWDPDAYFNHNAVMYTKILNPERIVFLRPSYSDTRQKVEDIISQLQEQKIDITNDYKEEWFKIAAAFANEFGESGRGYFHSVSKFYPEYNIRETNKMFDNVLKHNYSDVTIASFLKIASDYHINISPESTGSKPEINTQTTFQSKKPTVQAQRNPKLWSTELEDLESFFRIAKLPSDPIRLDKCTLITDNSRFIESHMNIIKVKNGNKRYLPYLERLQELKKLLISNQNRNN